MRFQRQLRYEAISMTQRKVAAFALKQQRERERYPLLADHVAAEQHDLATEEARRNDLARKSEQGMRDFHARVWREARRDFFAARPTQRQEINAQWRAWTGPTTSTYFRYVVDLVTGVMEQRYAAGKERERQTWALVAARLGHQPNLFQEFV